MRHEPPRGDVRLGLREAPGVGLGINVVEDGALGLAHDVSLAHPAVCVSHQRMRVQVWVRQSGPKMQPFRFSVSLLFKAKPPW